MVVPLQFQSFSLKYYCSVGGAVKRGFTRSYVDPNPTPTPAEILANLFPFPERNNSTPHNPPIAAPATTLKNPSCANIVRFSPRNKSVRTQPRPEWKFHGTFGQINNKNISVSQVYWTRKNTQTSMTITGNANSKVCSFQIALSLKRHNGAIRSLSYRLPSPMCSSTPSGIFQDDDAFVLNNVGSTVGADDVVSVGCISFFASAVDDDIMITFPATFLKLK